MDPGRAPRIPPEVPTRLSAQLMRVQDGRTYVSRSSKVRQLKRRLSVSPEHFVLVGLATSKAGVWMVRRLIPLHDPVYGVRIAHTEGWM